MNRKRQTISTDDGHDTLTEVLITSNRNIHQLQHIKISNIAIKGKNRSFEFRVWNRFFVTFSSTELYL